MNSPTDSPSPLPTQHGGYVRPTMTNADPATVINHGLLGQLMDSENDEDWEERQAGHDASVVNAMRCTNTFELLGLKLIEVTLETITMLQQINSPFITFTPLLSKAERAHFHHLAARKLEPDHQDGPLQPEEEQALERYAAKAKEENLAVGNPTLAILEFCAIHDPNLTDEQRDDLVFEQPRKVLRRHALNLGKTADLSDYELAGETIGRAIARAKSTKVRPLPEKGASPMGN